MCYVAKDIVASMLRNYVTVSTDTKLCSGTSKMCYEEAPPQTSKDAYFMTLLKKSEADNNDIDLVMSSNSLRVEDEHS
ncbi:hypothetical protein SFRURICE_011464 [Spodoptera frugiperda]|nr:hypothetical protein SFRURICE_011464 [Spodoptera frugiperda]